MKQSTYVFRMGLLLLLLMGLIDGYDQQASACQIVYRILCFDDQAPDTMWHMWPPVPNEHWGIHSGDYFDPTFCPTDNHSLWCLGYPSGNDPEFDTYPPNYDSYASYGPINLSTAVFAVVEWRLWNASEPQGDSVFWGASEHFDLTNEEMKIGGSEDMDTDGWESYQMDLSNLRDLVTGDSVSMLGLDSVYVFWRFRGNANQVADVGAFLDNVVIDAADGVPDLRIDMPPWIVDTACNPVNGDPSVGDTLRLRFFWGSCPGGPESYDPFHIVVAVDSAVVMDHQVMLLHSDESRDEYSLAWVVMDTGQFTARLKLDTLDQVAESDETNNAANVTYHVSPLTSGGNREDRIPQAFYLEQNYPNPFNPATEIRYGIRAPGQVILRVYDVLGRDVVTPVNNHREPGSYTVRLDGEGLPSGLYLYVLSTPEGTIGRKMVLLK